MLGGAPPDEDQPPIDDDLQPNMFDFFGFGQPGNGPNGGGVPFQQEGEGNNEAAPGAQPLEAVGWGL